ncbi:hypothetical protein LNV09_14595 [Paucibacter sp. B2R-40]|uniref:hypothetical protein n=1 Tax=Paucibacter sp. B2R-40 TaxID=2893554 RepID=UPI0021E40173|nr:hypothetical protein [Paucibacter sp. B2R-40]MCV2355380.1 hypothetical protein [Paucibacter sp. B2R-40]
MTSPAFSTIPLKRLIHSICSGVSVNASDTPAEYGQLGVLKTSCVYSGSFDPRENKTVIPEELGRVSCPVRANTLIVSRMNTPDLVGAAGLVTKDAPELFLPDRLWQVEFCSDMAVPRFVYWWTRSELYREQVKMACEGTSSSMQNLDQTSFRNFAVPRVSLSNQELIANFLDDKTARIDTLIAEKERLQEALTEWHAAELTRICFGADQPQLATGNGWIPSLPKGWKLMRLRHLVKGIEQGWSPECEARLADGDEWGVLKAGAANAGTYRENEHKALPASLKALPELEVKAGDVLITRASGTAEYVGSFAYVYGTRPRLMLSDKNFRLRFEAKPPLLPELLAWVCNTRALREQVLQFVSGADGLARNIGSGNLRELWLAVPPTGLQTELVAKLQTMRAQVGELHEHLLAHIDRLREYRSSLISAAVTGQLTDGAMQEIA